MEEFIELVQEIEKLRTGWELLNEIHFALYFNDERRIQETKVKIQQIIGFDDPE
jgi:hypothetical protein